MSRRDAALSLVIAGSLALTLGLKARLNDFGVAADSARLTRDIRAALSGAGYATAIEPHPYQSDVVVARSGACRLRVRDGTLHRDFDRVFRAQSGGLPRFAYWYRGQVLAQAPALESELRAFTARAAARLGLAASFVPPIAVAAAPGCNLARLPFTGLTMAFRARPARAAP